MDRVRWPLFSSDNLAGWIASGRRMWPQASRARGSAHSGDPGAVGCAAASIAAQRPDACIIWRGVLHAGWRRAGDATTIATHCARDVATLRRLRLYRNSIPRGASSGVDVAIEYITTG